MESAASVARPEERSVTGTYGLRERVFEGPGQTDIGRPKRLSRRAQDPIIDDLRHPIVDGDRLSSCALA